MKSLEYLAGLFDGEGSFSIQVGLRHRTNGRTTGWVNPAMSVNLYYGDEVLDHFVDAFGGQIYPYRKGGRRWHLGRRVELLAAAQSLEPLLEIKRGIAQEFIRAIGLFPEGRFWQPEQVIAVGEIALTLNPSRSRRSPKTLEYLNVLRAELSNGNA